MTYIDNRVYRKAVNIRKRPGLILAGTWQRARKTSAWHRGFNDSDAAGVEAIGSAKSGALQHRRLHGTRSSTKSPPGSGPESTSETSRVFGSWWKTSFFIDRIAVSSKTAVWSLPAVRPSLPDWRDQTAQIFELSKRLDVCVLSFKPFSTKRPYANGRTLNAWWVHKLCGQPTVFLIEKNYICYTRSCIIRSIFILLTYT